MSGAKLTDDETFASLVAPVVDYLCIRQTPQKADAIFLFGSLKLPAVWRQAAELYRQGYAPKILVAGGVGAANAGERSRFGLADGSSESAFIRNELIELGVPFPSIITEERSTNTLENIVFGMRRLKEEGLDARRLMLVSKPFHARRCLATFERQFPSVEVICSPPKMSVLEAVDRPRKEFAERLLGELDRLRTYADKGDISRQELPTSIKDTARKLGSVLAEKR